MKITTCKLTILATLLCAAPAFAQQAKQPLNRQVDAAVQRAQAQAASCSCAQTPLDESELIEAEEELQQIRDTKDNHATFKKYPYLLDPVYRRHKNGSCPSAATLTAPVAQKAPRTAVQNEPLTPQEEIEAEEELQQIRNTWDMHATFDKYPYLLDPAYRRADEAEKQSIRRQYTQPTWAQKVGI